MAVVVQKFGGSSVATPEKLAQVADLVARARKQGHQVVVVVSAMGKTTDELLTLAQQVSRTPQGGAVDAPRRELDMLVSTGERVSMALLAIAMAARELEAISFTGSQSGIITNDRHFDARIIEVRPHRIEDELARGRVVIVAGYQGMSYKREITTLGRGGSDTTAVALAAALGAERCEIYSDVDGVFSADPRSVPDARHLPEIDYEAMQEMAEAGAKVLNARAVEWARRHKVAIHARRTADFAQHGEGRETVVREGNGVQHGMFAVVAERRLALLRVRAESAPALLAAAAERELVLRDATLERGELSCVLPLWSVPDAESMREELRALTLSGFEWREGFASVSVVGVGAGAEPANLARVLAACAAPPLAVYGTPLRVTALLPEAAALESERALHAAFSPTPI